MLRAVSALAVPPVGPAIFPGFSQTAWPTTGLSTAPPLQRGVFPDGAVSARSAAGPVRWLPPAHVLKILSNTMSLMPGEAPPLPPPPAGRGVPPSAPPAGSNGNITGDLGLRPLPRLLHYLEKKKITGQMTIETSGGNIIIFFRDGWPVHVTTPEPKDTLGEVLLEMGRLSLETYLESLTIMQIEHEQDNRLRHGKILRDMGLIGDSGLIEGLNTQLKVKLLCLFMLDRGRFVVTSDGHEWGAGETDDVRVDPYRMIMTGIRNCFTEERLRRDLEPIWNQPISLGKSFDEHRPRLDLKSEESQALRLLRSGLLRPCDLATQAKIDGRKANALVYALWVCDLFETQTRVTRTVAPVVRPGDLQGPGAAVESRADATAVRPPSRPAVTPGMRGVVEVPGAARLREEIDRKLRSIEGADHFQVLEVGRSADCKEIHAAFLRLATLYHPDNLARLGLQDMKSAAEEITRRLGEAHSTLMNSEDRRRYESGLDIEIAGDRGGGGMGQAQLFAEADLNFKMGLDHLRRGDFPKAEFHLSLAKDQNPNEGEHLAYYAWAMFQNPQRNAGEIFPDVFDMIMRACNLSPQSAPCFFLLGEALALQSGKCKDRGNISEALQREREAWKAFQTVLALRPGHEKAERWVAILRRRFERQAETAPLTQRFVRAIQRLTTPKGKPRR